ncbi:hypothetical protein GCM10010381_66660 [Streptomyces xantholiticus]|nr:hypothetical protein GCM10010381_66660 [Streptomyces xantholiticus]
MTQRADVVVIGGGQAGLAAGYHLRRLGVDFTVLDAQSAPGGAWQYMWDSLHLFSPAAYSSLPGRLMPPQPGQTYPDGKRVVDYLADYEKRYELPIQRGIQVDAVQRDGQFLRVESGSGSWRARAVFSAIGSWSRPFLPAVPGRDVFTGRQLHTAQYRRPADFAGQRVIVVGGGNSGAQIAADLAHETELTWVTRREPRFLADDIDGRILFDVATARRRALDEERTDTGGVASLGEIVAVPPVREAGTQDYSRPSRCSSASPRTASSGPTAAAQRPTRSSGARASARPSLTSRHSGFAARAGT